MRCPEMGEFALCLPVEEVLPVPHHLLRVVEVDVRLALLRRSVGQLARQDGVDGQESVAKLRMLQVSVLILIKDIHEIANVRLRNGLAV